MMFWTMFHYFPTIICHLTRVKKFLQKSYVKKYFFMRIKLSPYLSIDYESIVSGFIVASFWCM